MFGVIEAEGKLKEERVADIIRESGKRPRIICERETM
jgi:hypothetical protein